MFAFNNAAKCITYSKCGCIPGAWTERVFQRFFTVESSNRQSAWDYLRDKLGLQKKGDNKQDIAEEFEAGILEPERIPMDTNSKDEMWKPGYRGRTENKRF